MENLDLSYLGTILDLSDIPQMYKQLKKTASSNLQPKARGLSRTLKNLFRLFAENNLQHFQDSI